MKTRASFHPHTNAPDGPRDCREEREEGMMLLELIPRVGDAGEVDPVPVRERGHDRVHEAVEGPLSPEVRGRAGPDAARVVGQAQERSSTRPPHHGKPDQDCKRPERERLLPRRRGHHRGE